MKPFLRYVGGKRRLLPHIYTLLGTKPIRDYYEPCVGGGAVFFDIHERVKGDSYLNDINQDLMLAYTEVRDNLPALQGYLEGLSGKVLEGLPEIEYTAIRTSFNEHAHYYGPYRAAEFIALNHLCFNGLWRENRNGQMNVPVGKGAKSLAYPEGKLRSLSTFDFKALGDASLALQGAIMDAVPLVDFMSPTVNPGKGDFVFYDPPYLQEFSNYSKEKFGQEQHAELASQAKACAARGARVIVCGANRANTHAIYGKPSRVIALERTVGCKDRGLATEALYCYGKFA